MTIATCENKNLSVRVVPTIGNNVPTVVTGEGRVLNLYRAVPD
jgi:hypothetical protein